MGGPKRGAKQALSAPREAAGKASTLPGGGVPARTGQVVYEDTAPLGPPGPHNQGPGLPPSSTRR